MPRHAAEESAQRPWRHRLHVVIFQHDTRAGKTFDKILLALIAASVLVAVLESVPAIKREHGRMLLALEWAFTILFTIEYLLRLVSVRSPLRYATSFFGIIDLLAILPTYASLFYAGTQELIVIRAFRLLRIFRVLKLPEYLGEANLLTRALWASRRKITVFLLTVMTIVLIVGALMHLIEGPRAGFTSIPAGMYWAIVTLTTVGYGDIAPQTPLGRFLAAAVMILGYGIIAVPTGIVTAELIHATRSPANPRRCPACQIPGHDPDAQHCKHCGARL
jgi:voltage-gated potassium channel